MRSKTVFFCTQCGHETPKWQGRCPGCGEWNTMAEQPAAKAPSGASAVRRGSRSGAASPVSITEIETGDEPRFLTGMGELDRVLGGGMVKGALTLIAGEPGIGKSTLVLQICSTLCRSLKVLYVSGEESRRQIKMRAQRLGVQPESLLILAETGLEAILETARAETPDILIVDSIQTVYHSELSAAPGNVAQVKECAMALMQLAKGEGITVLVIGHVNKDGGIAGPKVLEHMVDCVLYFEGDSHASYRLLRAAKNRFGSTNEIGVFEMGQLGLTEVPNPSEMFLSGRPLGTPGTCVACIMEGSRPVLAEVQALVTPTSFGNPRRMAEGIDYNRAMLLLAVLEKRSGLFMGNCDAYINVVGGFRFDEPAADLPTVLAIASSVKDKPVPDNIAAFGEVGLTGELRSVTAASQRLAEIKRLGFTRCVMPAQKMDSLWQPDGLEIIRAAGLRQALAAVFNSI